MVEMKCCRDFVAKVFQRDTSKKDPNTKKNAQVKTQIHLIGVCFMLLKLGGAQGERLLNLSCIASGFTHTLVLVHRCNQVHQGSLEKKVPESSHKVLIFDQTLYLLSITIIIFFANTIIIITILHQHEEQVPTWSLTVTHCCWPGTELHCWS